METNNFGQGEENRLEDTTAVDINVLIEKLKLAPKDLKKTEVVALIKHGEGKSVLHNIDSLEGISHSEIAIEIINAGDVVTIGRDISDGVGWRRGPARSSLGKYDMQGKLKDLDISIADKIVQEGKSLRSLVYGIKKFKEEYRSEIADKIIEAGQGNEILKNVKDFFWLKSEIVEYIKKYAANADNGNVYKFRNEFSMEEIISRYDFFRVESWSKEGVLELNDKESLEKIRNFIDEETLGKLWENITKEELHIIAPEIVKIFQISKYSKDTFRGEYLERIIKDGAKYGEQQIEPLRHFHQVAQSIYEPELEKDTSSFFVEASSFEQTRAIAEQLKREGLFKNWETLKKYHELSEVLKQREVLEKLQKLKDEGKDKQYTFFSNLAFHPGSKISMQTVFQFMENPARFLDVEDDHSGEAHERKKPSNYTRFEYLDISAEDLRDALIEGTLDRLQYFKPFEAQYKITDKNYTDHEIIDLLKNALGSFREKIKGNAKNPGKLFKITEEILKRHIIEYKDIVNNPSSLQQQVRGELEQALFDVNFGIKDTRKSEEFLVKIHPKSSPEGHLAGNDTACCMPFGSGKNNVYMYNLGCSILTVQRKVGDSYRTIAQSVLTPDVDIKHNIADLVSKVQDETLLSSVITEDLTQKKTIIITADNIEVAPNAEKYKISVEKIYQDFVSRYAQEIDSGEIDKNRMLIGKGYSDLNFSQAKNVNNTFIPITPVAYSDNYGSEVYELPLNEKSEIVPLPEYGMLQKQEKETVDPDLPKGVQYLTAHDTLRVSYMEGKVYAENESLVQYIHRIGNELTAKDINNNFKNRPNLSLKVEDETGAMLGYMIAYEGAEKNDNYDEDNDEVSQNKELGQKVIYISDLAADTARSKLAGGRLIKAFKTLIKREYLDKNNFIPIVMQAREATSYAIVLNQLENELRKNLDKEYGYTFEVEESGSYEAGSDTMHQIKLRPIKV